jgi:rhamnogalacturonan acetylesterase
MPMLKPNDSVLVQIGQNDVFAIDDDTRARGTLPGTENETQEIDNLLNART